ncbi:MAG: SDR family oxidoreductase [Pseudomonadota bacterium]
MTIAITGASGHLGRLVIASLKERGSASNIIALARTPEKAADLGVAIRAADYSKPQTQEQALAGVDTLLLISSSEIGQRVAQHRNVIDQAKTSGVKRIVYTSLLHADTSPLGLAAEHLATEAALKASGVAFTILRNGWYTENYEAAIGSALAHGAFIGAAGAGKIAAAPRADYAEAAAVVLTGTGHEGKIYELAGDEAFTLAELAAEVSKQTGRTLPYENLPEADYAAALLGAGLPEPFAKLLADCDAGAAKGALFDAGHQLSGLIGRPTVPFATVIAAALG